MGYFDFRREARAATTKTPASSWKNGAKSGNRKEHPKNETISEHLKHCTAKNCPFLRFADADAFDPSQGPNQSEPQLVTAIENGEAKTVKVDARKPISSEVFEKLAAAMSDMWSYANSLDRNKEDERIVRRVLENGLSAMHEELESNDCITKTDDKTEKVVILPPSSEKE